MTTPKLSDEIMVQFLHDYYAVKQPSGYVPKNWFRFVAAPKYGVSASYLKHAATRENKRVRAKRMYQKEIEK